MCHVGAILPSGASASLEYIVTLVSSQRLRLHEMAQTQPSDRRPLACPESRHFFVNNGHCDDAGIYRRRPVYALVSFPDGRHELRN
jgi:hypothetical protein